MQAVASMLAGEHNPRVDRIGLDRLSTFGVLPGKSSDEALRILRVLLANDWIDLTSNEFPCPIMTAAGLAGDEGRAGRPRAPAPAARGEVAKARARLTSRAEAASERGREGQARSA